MKTTASAHKMEFQPVFLRFGAIELMVIPIVVILVFGFGRGDKIGSDGKKSCDFLLC